EPFGKKALDELTEGAQNLSVQLESLNMTAGTLMPEENPDLTFTTESGKTWTLSGTRNAYWSEKNVINVISILTGSKTPSKAPDKAYLSAYISSLAVAAEKEEPQTVNLIVCYKDWKRASSIPRYIRQFSVTPEQARALLQKLYDEAFIQKYCRCVPFSLYAGEKPEEISTLYDLREALKGGFSAGLWAYFPQKELFDPLEDIGFSLSEFEDEWKEAVEHQEKLCLFL
ncbi:MAG: hypothetical protein K6G80_03685, partial [Treponema sp.]|nr:hypothetical protein [Treponema sp.]